MIMICVCNYVCRSACVCACVTASSLLQVYVACSDIILPCVLSGELLQSGYGR